MKVTTGVLLASLAASGVAARGSRHARFHDEKRYTEILDAHKRAVDADPTLMKRCGEMINTTGPWGPMSFPNCFGSCEGQGSCSSGQGSSQPASQPAAQPAASSPAAAPQVNENVVKPQSSPKPAATSAAPASHTSASSSNSGSSSTPSSSGKGGKIQFGLSYDTASFISGKWLEGSATWTYNWNPVPNGLNAPNLQFVPELHKPAWVSNFNAAKSSFQSGVPLLSLNEPDIVSSGSCGYMQPSDACSIHNGVFGSIGDHPVGSPAVSGSTDSGTGLDWLSGFQKACGSAKVDFIPLHWYGPSGSDAETQANKFIEYAQNAQSTVNKLYPGKPIWFSELAAQPMNDAQLNAQFLTAVFDKLKDNTYNIERIAPFMVGPNGCLGDGTPSAAGTVLLAA